MQKYERLGGKAIKYVSKAAFKLTIKSKDDIFAYLKEKYKGSEIKIDEIMKAGTALREFTVPRESVKDIKKILEENKVPFATLKINGEEKLNKIVYFEAHIDTVNKSLERYLNSKMEKNLVAGKNLAQEKNLSPEKALDLKKDKKISL